MIIRRSSKVARGSESKIVGIIPATFRGKLSGNVVEVDGYGEVHIEDREKWIDWDYMGDGVFTVRMPKSIDVLAGTKPGEVRIPMPVFLRPGEARIRIPPLLRSAAAIESPINGGEIACLGSVRPQDIVPRWDALVRLVTGDRARTRAEAESQLLWVEMRALLNREGYATMESCVSSGAVHPFREFIREWNEGKFVRQYSLVMPPERVTFVLTGPTWPERIEKYDVIVSGDRRIEGNIFRNGNNRTVYGLAGGQLVAERASVGPGDKARVRRREIVFDVRSEYYRNLVRFPPTKTWEQSLRTMGIRGQEVSGIPLEPGFDPRQSEYFATPPVWESPGKNTFVEVVDVVECCTRWKKLLRVPDGVEDWAGEKDIAGELGIPPRPAVQVKVEMTGYEAISEVLGFRVAALKVPFGTICWLLNSLDQTRSDGMSSA